MTDPAPARRPDGPLVGVMLLPVATTFDRLVATAQLADELGYHAIWLFDHLDTPHAQPGQPTLDVYEGWTTATVVAARTERIRIGHNVLCAGFRHPAVLAKMAATLDVASGGRLELGIGWGSMPDELARFGLGADPPAIRAARLGETLDILELMFTGQPFSYSGEHFVLTDAVGRPIPQQHRIPIQIGGAGPKLTLPLVARHADWWNCPPDAFDRINQLRPLTGSARVAMQAVVGLAASAAQRDEVTDQVRARFGLWGSAVIGTPDEVAAGLRDHIDRGVEQLIVQFHDYGRPATLRLFAQDVLPALVHVHPGRRSP